MQCGLGLLHQGADKLAWVLVLPLYGWIYQHHRLFDFSAGWLSFFLLFLGQDFLYYWFHRVSHRVRWLWAAHSVHHSSTRMNFTTAFRQSLMYPLAGMWAFWLPLAWLGFPPEQVVAVVLLNLAFQFFVHTQAAPSWAGWSTCSTPRPYTAATTPRTRATSTTTTPACWWSGTGCSAPMPRSWTAIRATTAR
ncbi:Fatty acid hydroxylase superfamily [Chromobacterium violaceum]|uniref:Fatty acid hydroxylase superfamily n=1 Tax=Chromobacterium violaceum TaxID=536 RepID=A0A3S4IKG4_CHRVL|nr:Fatty acid hydroxylase superfamily [Chromobacterium violaceum]